MKATLDTPATTTIRLIALDEVNTDISRWECALYSGSGVEVQLSSHFTPDAPSHTVRLRVDAVYTTLRGQIVRRLLESSVEAAFQINGEEAQFNQYETMVDYDLVRIMINIAVGALRGIIAQHTRNTFLRHYPLPIYNTDALVDDIIRSYPLAT